MKLPKAEHEQWLNAALEALKRNDSLAAKTQAEKVLRVVPLHTLAMVTLGVALANLGQGREALAALEHAVRLTPDNAMFRYNFAVTLAQLGYEDRAMLEYRACLQLSPEHPDALWNYGEMLRLREQFAAALRCFERLLADGQQYLSLHHRAAVCCNALGLDERARELFARALATEPDDLTHWEYAHFLLARGEFAAGWTHYAHRFGCGQKISVYCAQYPYPAWDGSLSDNSVLLVHGEQGYGDEIMFAGYLPKLLQAASGGMRVILACRPALVDLFATSFPGLRVVPHQVDKPADITGLIGATDAVFHCPIGSLPRHIGPLPGMPPQAYLRAPEQLISDFNLKLKEHAGDATLKVGLMWGANPGVKSQHAQQRNLPVRLLNRLAGLDGVRFVGLQNAERGDEIADAPELNCIDLSRRLNSFADTAALIANLDLIITVCTSVAHLAAAMGKETWVVLQHRAEWRWGRDRDDSVWYSHARLFRQPEPGDWHGTLRAVRAALESRLSTG